jgi:hypothetical protein
MVDTRGLTPNALLKLRRRRPVAHSAVRSVAAAGTVGKNIPRNVKSITSCGAEAFYIPAGSRPSKGYRHHEDNAGSSCSWLIGAHDKWRERIPVESKRLSIVFKSGSGNLCEPVVLLVEDQPQGATQGGQALRPRRRRGPRGVRAANDRG